MQRECRHGARGYPEAEAAAPWDGYRVLGSDVDPRLLEPLWRPALIGGVEVKNRVLIPAHQTHFSLEEHDLVGERYIAYMEARARGGAGLLVVEAGAIHPSTEKAGLLSLFREASIPGLRRLADAVHGHDCRIFAQLSHLGSQDLGNSHIDKWHPVIAPSPLPSVVYGRVAQAIDEEEIAGVVAGYGQAAANAQAAGLDGAEIAGAHGYLMTQFLSPLTNHRSDRYGGSTENRCRFAIEAATEIRRRCGRSFPLGIRLSFDEFLGEAAITPALGEEVIRTLHAGDLFDYFSISCGNYHTVREWVPSISGGRDGHLAPYAERAKRVVASEVPIFVASAIRTIERAAEIVGSGQADLVAMMRAHIADPEIVNKARSGRAGEIRRCVGANQGCLRRLFEHEMIACTVNPVAGRERQLGRPREPAAEPLSVLVVGGGPAGMKLAEAAAEGGHAVTLVERAPRLGGQLLSAGRLPNRQTWVELADDLSASIRRLGVEIRLETEATAEIVAAAGADRIFLATGSSFDKSGHSIAVPGRDAISGADSDHVLDPVEAIEHPERCGARTVIVDDNGDHLPLGLALLLADGERKVRVVSRQLFAGNRLITTGDIPWLYPQLSEAGVAVDSQMVVSRIDPGEVVCEDVWGNGSTSTPADTVILSMMKHSNDALYEELTERGVEVTRVGDCVAPREVDDAIFEGLVTGIAVGDGDEGVEVLLADRV